MTSTIKVNNIQNQCGANIINESSNTITIGASGDTIALASGASQTGFGRTGTVDWQTGSIKTSTFTAVNGQGFFADTTSGGFTMNLPAGTAGAIVSVADYAGTFNTGNLTITPNGSQKIGGFSANVVLDTIGQSVTFVYVDDTEGWINTMDSTSNVRASEFITATGGTISCSGNDRIHTFTGPGSFVVSAAAACAANNVISYLVVGAGGTGGSCNSGGGGAGGFREVKSPVTPYTASPLDGYPTPGNRITVAAATTYPVSVGAGASAQTGGFRGDSGSNSQFSTIIAAGGGGGGSNANSPINPGLDGGSGGGASFDETSPPAVGAGNTPSVTPPQGNPGGVGTGPGANAGGGGGGANAAGAQGSTPSSGDGGAGGAGATTSINGSPTVYAGGGGGGAGSSANGGAGGSGGGGYGSNNPGVPNPNNPGATPETQAGNGAVNTGGGGGGSNGPNPGSASPSTSQVAGTGGSGIVIIRYKRA